MRLSNEVREQARVLIASRLGLDFPERRQSDLERGLLRALRSSPVADPGAYLTWIATLPDDSPEWRQLAAFLTVGETYFFRDRSSFEALEEKILPPLIMARRLEGNLRLRLWSAGCATGEEPYSLGVLLSRLLPDLSEWAVTILATDIDRTALDAARRGIYREWSLRETPPWIQDRYFHRRGVDAYEVEPRIRRMVTLAPLNLADGFPAVMTNTSAMDLILCRNVIMYFTREAQRATAARLQRALVAGGWLVVSPAEASTDLFRPLVPVNFPGAIFYLKEAEEPQPTLPTSPLSGWQGDLVPPDLGVPPTRARIPEAMTRPPEDRAGVPRPGEENVLQRARVLADQGNLEGAQRLCEAALARDRLDPEAHLLLAAIFQERGGIQPALEALRRAIYLAPDSAPAHFLLGTLLLREGKRKRGRQSMETVVRLLTSVPRDQPVPGSDGLTAGRLLETARAYLESRS